MKVYVALYDYWNYEAYQTSIVGVFADEEAAKEAAIKAATENLTGGTPMVWAYRLGQAGNPEEIWKGDFIHPKKEVSKQ